MDYLAIDYSLTLITYFIGQSFSQHLDPFADMMKATCCSNCSAQCQSRTREGGESAVVTARQAVMCLPLLFYWGITTISRVYKTRVQKEKNIRLVSSAWVQENGSFSGVRGQNEQSGSTR